jgi:hypothetical protein
MYTASLPSHSFLLLGGCYCPSPADVSVSFHYEKAKMFIYIAKIQYFYDWGKAGTFVVRHELSSVKPIKPELFWENG